MCSHSYCKFLEFPLWRHRPKTTILPASHQQPCISLHQVWSQCKLFYQFQNRTLPRFQLRPACQPFPPLLFIQPPVLMWPTKRWIFNHTNYNNSSRKSSFINNHWLMYPWTRVKIRTSAGLFEKFSKVCSLQSHSVNPLQCLSFLSWLLSIQILSFVPFPNYYPINVLLV